MRDRHVFFSLSYFGFIDIISCESIFRRFGSISVMVYDAFTGFISQFDLFGFDQHNTVDSKNFFPIVSDI